MQQQQQQQVRRRQQQKQQQCYSCSSSPRRASASLMRAAATSRLFAAIVAFSLVAGSGVDALPLSRQQQLQLLQQAAYEQQLLQQQQMLGGGGYGSGGVEWQRLLEGGEPAEEDGGAGEEEWLVGPLGYATVPLVPVGPQQPLAAARPPLRGPQRQQKSLWMSAAELQREKAAAASKTAIATGTEGDKATKSAPAAAGSARPLAAVEKKWSRFEPSIRFF